MTPEQAQTMQRLAAEKAAPPPAPVADSVDTSVNIPAANPPDPQQLMDTTVPDKSLVERSFRRAGQDVLATPAVVALPRLGIAGLQYMTGINNTFEEGVMTDQAASLYSMATDSSDAVRQAAATNALNSMSDDQKIRPVMRWAKDWYDWGGEVAGTVDNPDGSIPLDEEVGGIALTAATAIPTGGLGVIAKGLGFSGKLSAKLASSTALKTAGRVAELATPLTIGATKSNMAANAAVGLALNDVVRYALDEDTLTESVLGYDDDLPNAEGNASSTTSEKVAVGGAALGVAAASMAFGRGAGRLASKVDDVVPQIGDDVAQLGEIPMQGPRDVIKTAENKLMDESAVIKQAAEITVGKEAAEQLDDVVRAKAGNTIDAQVDRAYRMGALSQDGSIKFHKPLNAVREPFKQMPPAKQQLADRTYDALNKKSNMKRFRRKGADTSELDNIINIGMADPQIRMYVNDVDQVMKKLSEMSLKEGVITSGQHRRQMSRGYYMPQKPKADDIGMVRQAADKVGSLFTVRNNKADNIDVAGFTKQRKKVDGEFEPISKTFDDTVQSRMREINLNTARREVLEKLDDQRVTNLKGGENRVLVRKLDSNEQTSNRVVKVMAGGKETRYEVGDKRLMRALQFRPRAALPIANNMRKFYQATTTGWANPLFAGMSALYDMTFAALGTRTHRVTGPLDAALKNMGAPESVRAALAGPVRVVDIPYTYMQGVFNGLYGRRLEMQAVRAAELAAKTGNALDQAAATKVADKYLQSLYGTMHRYGRTGGVLTETAAELDTARTMMKKKLTDVQAIRWYNHALDTVRDGMQMGLFTRNYADTVNDVHQDAVKLAARQGATPPTKVSTLSEAEVMRLANDVRNIAADPTKQAASDVVNVVASSVPYGNIILQSTGHLAHHMLTNRAAQSTVAFMGALKVWSVMTMSAEQREHYEQTMPAWQRVGFMPMHFGPGVDDMVLMPIGPELGTVTSVAAEAMQGMIESDNELKIMSTPERLLSSFTDLIGFAAPPALTVPIAAIAGQQPRIGDALRGEGFLKDPTEYAGIPEQRGIGMNEGMVGDRLAAIMYSATGVAGRMIIDSAEALLDHPSGALTRDAWAAAMDVVKYNQGKQPVAQGIGLVFGNQVVKPDARVTPLSDKAYEVDRALKQANNVFRGLDPDYDQELDVDIPYSALQQLPNILKNPDLQYQAELLNEYFYAPDHAVIMKEIGQLHEGYRRTRNNPNNKIKDVNTVLRQINDATNDRYKELLANYSEFEEYMSEQTQSEWTINRFMIDAVKDVYSE